MLFSFVVCALAGCAAPEDIPIWEKVKIRDLAPSDQSGQPRPASLKAINFVIYTFELPAENVSFLDGVWESLHLDPISFNNKEIFTANSFSTGFGEIRMWNEIGDLLRAGGGRKLRTISLLLFDGQSNDLKISAIREEKDVFYISDQRSMESVRIGFGELNLRIWAKRIASQRGVCSIKAVPVLVSPSKRSMFRLAGRSGSGDFSFDPAGFNLKMSPGDFFFLGPTKYIDNQITLGGLFFSGPADKRVFRTYVIVCTKIDD